MIHAYQEIYLNKIQRRLAVAFDYAINECHIKCDDFVKMFLMSNIANEIENGNVFIIVGKSGIEIANEIIEYAKEIEISYYDSLNYYRTKDYWIGYVLAYYQWYSNRTFCEIFEIFSYEDLEKMYFTLHEADISKFVEIVDEKIKNHFKETNLKRIRQIYGISQSELANKSGVNIRSIQMYEQKNKDINKASVQTIYSISKVLGCKIEDLIER